MSKWLLPHQLLPALSFRNYCGNREKRASNLSRQELNPEENQAELRVAKKQIGISRCSQLKRTLWDIASQSWHFEAKYHRAQQNYKGKRLCH
jgi:hypothetical protein